MDDERIMNGETIDEATEVVESSGVDFIGLAKKIGPVGAGLVATGGICFLAKKLLNKAGFELRSPIVRKQKTDAVVEPEYEDYSEAEG